MALEMKYFVLKPKAKYRGDPYADAARVAMITFANLICNVDPELANSLCDWVEKEINNEEEKC